MIRIVINTKQDIRIRVNICNSFNVATTILAWLCLRGERFWGFWEREFECVYIFFILHSYLLLQFKSICTMELCIHRHIPRFYLCNWACKFALKLYVDTDFLMLYLVVVCEKLLKKFCVSVCQLLSLVSHFLALLFSQDSHFHSIRYLVSRIWGSFVMLMAGIFLFRVFTFRRKSACTSYRLVL